MTLLPKCSHIPVFALYTVTRLYEESSVAFYDVGERQVTVSVVKQGCARVVTLFLP